MTLSISTGKMGLSAKWLTG